MNPNDLHADSGEAITAPVGFAPDEPSVGAEPISTLTPGSPQTAGASVRAGGSGTARPSDKTRPGQGKPGRPEGIHDSSKRTSIEESRTPTECGFLVVMFNPVRLVRVACKRKTCDMCRHGVGEQHFAKVRAAFDRGTDLHAGCVDKDLLRRLKNRKSFRPVTYKGITHGMTATVIADAAFEGSTRVPSREALDDILDTAYALNIEAGLGNNISGSRVWVSGRRKQKQEGPGGLIVTGSPAKAKEIIQKWNETHHGPVTDEDVAVLALVLGANPAEVLKTRRKAAAHERLAVAEREWEALVDEDLRRPF